MDHLATLSIADLLRAANADGVSRQMSICYTQFAHARTALAARDAGAARAHYEAAKRAFARAHEDEAGQLRRAAAVQQVVVARGADRDCVAERKVVAANKVLTSHVFTWHSDASDR